MLLRRKEMGLLIICKDCLSLSLIVRLIGWLWKRNRIEGALDLTWVLFQPAKTVKREPVTSASRLHNSCYPSTPTGNSHEPMAKRVESVKKEPKPEPIVYEEAPLPCSSNTSFSATMSSYQYIICFSLTRGLCAYTRGVKWWDRQVGSG